jgi:glyoxylase-like metal-dependent hydrolase (beta-lactamase superfamily II)
MHHPEPEVEAVTEHVIRIALPLPLEDLHSVNAYAVRGDDGITLIDPGWAAPETEEVLVRALRGWDATPQDVVRFLATHHHWDHYTQAVVWQRAYGIPIHLGREERHSMQAWLDLDGAYPVQVDLLRRAGADELAAIIARIEVEPHEEAMAFDPPAHWLDGSETWDLGATTLVAHSTPGHTRGHVVFEDTGSGLLFTGDHVLPRITPSIAYERQPDPMSLRSYLASLQLLLDRPDVRMLPAHGLVQDSTWSRVEALLDHHAQRLQVIADLVAAGEPTAYAIARRMTWTRHERTLDELGAVHGMTAVLEVAAHLELLGTLGRVRGSEQEGRDLWVAA